MHSRTFNSVDSVKRKHSLNVEYWLGINKWGQK